MIAAAKYDIRISQPKTITSQNRERLTGKQKLFCDIWVGAANFNGTLAAEMAGYNGSNSVLRVIASQNLTKLNIRAYIKKKLRKKLPRLPELNIELAELPEPIARDIAGTNVIHKINEIRRSLAPEEKEFDNYLAAAASEVKYNASISDKKRRNLVLYSVERSHGHTVSEISEDTRLSEIQVKTIIAELIGEGILETIERLTIGGSVNQTLILSRRNPCECV